MILSIRFLKYDKKNIRLISFLTFDRSQMMDKPRYGSLEDIDIGLISGRQPIRDTDSDISTGHMIVKVLPSSPLFCTNS